jgi:hypothetical protein
MHRAVTSAINRYYDPATDEFLSIDPQVDQTNQPYVFTGDDPLNAEDPLGLCSWWDVACDAVKAAKWAVHHPLEVAIGISLVASVVATGGADLAFVGLTVSVDEASTAATFFGAAGTVGDIAGTTSAIGNSVQCVASKAIGNCIAAALSVLTAGVSFLPAAGEVAKSGQIAIGATLSTGSTAMDISVGAAKIRVKVKKKK